MVNDRRLFERMTDPESPGARRRGIDTRTLTESVVHYLAKMMNSRHGCTLIQPDFGIPDLNEFMYAFPESLGMMRTAIQQAIEKYEPRLKSVRIRYIENPDRPVDIHFQITAQLITEDETIPVSFSTRTGSSGGLDVVE
jgi:type VI secretion system protein